MRKKKGSILKIFVILVLILLLSIIVHIIKNNIIIGKLYKKQVELKNLTNYYYISENNSSDEDKNIIEHYYKDGKSKLVLNNGNIILWNDKSTRENIMIDLENKIADITTSDYVIGNEFPIFIDETFKNIKAYLFSSISSDVFNGVKCYKVDYKNHTILISKNDGMLLKVIDKSLEEQTEIIFYRDFKLNSLNDSDVEKPDLSGYEINNT